ncbi:uroporphyrinogen-III synthase [Empedobacter sp. 225-1]|uniref:uroporphyrinogen-III synthase n=1 Tax=unclassified Empedobacter TaxID=2643773 RepID=UPI002577F29B|nr:MULTISPECIES: uroporphyrinogen-III synthase [unclassified Empedobacter]MDM1524271.1 uroporphyrinogen-III synthase [Empedobacter sp. 225-1]MDM1544178.1 uroporphyrinogen-III synthase [Empedobacter sp. 189-2]
MRTKVLFTKLISSSILEKEFGTDVEVVCKPTLQIELTSVNEISKQIDYSVNQFIVTSQNTVNAINGLDLNGHFFVVGKKTAEKLKAQNREVILVEDYAEDLAPKLISGNYLSKWNFLCGSSRRDLLVNELSKANHEVNQIVTYQSEQIVYQLNNTFDMYAFFSPLSFKAFHQQNEIPESSTIFTVGNTTTFAIKEVYPNHKIITAQTPLVEVVIENIKKYINDKK